MKAPAIALKNISLHYPRQVLLENFNATFAAGQFNCILGSSGIGKSSLLRLIAGLIHPHKPSQHYSGQIIASDGLPLHNRIAYMAQTHSLLPWLTVIDNLLIGKKLRGQLQAKDKEHAYALLQQVGLAAAAKKFPWQLSGGMKQKAALARTLLENKSIVLMDEPFSALDVVTRAQLQELAVTALADRTVIMVTHDPQEALRMGQHIFVMTHSPLQLMCAAVLPGPLPRNTAQPAIYKLQNELIAKLVSVNEAEL